MVSPVVLLDHHDSFTHNIRQALMSVGHDARPVLVLDSHVATLAQIAALAPSHLVLGPGPRRPEDSGITLAVIQRFAGHLPLLGICLGHQALGQAFGAKLVAALRPMHGKTCQVHHNQSGLFQGLPNPFEAGRYNSLVLEALPPGWVLEAWDEIGEIMAMRHPHLPMAGVQFHPESFLTPGGERILANFLGFPGGVHLP